MHQVMTILSHYHLHIMVGLFVLLLLFSRKKRNKTLFFIALIALAGSILYEAIWHEPVSRIPVRINQALNHPPPTQSSNLHYYAIPENEKKLLDEE